MLINQDFAQPEAKSPAKRRLQLVVNDTPNIEESKYSPPVDTATQLLQETITKIDGAYAPSTIRAYRVDFQDLIKFCSERNTQALPAQPPLVVKYIQKLTGSGRSSASIRRAIAGIATIHKLNRLTDPTKDPDVILEMRRMHRKLGRASHQAQAVTSAILDKLLDATEDDLRGARDRALLLVAYDTMCRRSELVGLQIEDVESYNTDSVRHMSVLIRQSKTDQESLGRRLYVSERTKIAVEKWMGKLKIKQGKLFRGVSKSQAITSSLGASQINRIYKRIAKNAEIDRSLIQGISGHSMRVGHAQDLLKSGVSMAIIMSKGRWSKTDTVMRYLDHVAI
jgi:site-specific recombinase XerD